MIGYPTIFDRRCPLSYPITSENGVKTRNTRMKNFSFRRSRDEYWWAVEVYNNGDISIGAHLIFEPTPQCIARLPETKILDPCIDPYKNIFSHMVKQSQGGKEIPSWIKPYQSVCYYM